MDDNKELRRYLAALPGIGPRQASRIVYSLLKREPNYSRRLGQLIQQVRSHMRLCQETYHYFYSESGEDNLSDIAKDPNRQHDQVLVVESDSDLENIEKIGLWQGTYFVLGGSLKPSMSESEYEKYVRLSDLRRVLSQKNQDDALTEVVLGLSSTVSGDFTSKVITELVQELDNSISISRLGRGLSTGTSLEYVDKNTLKEAIEHRTK